MATFSYVQNDTSRTFDVGCSGQSAGVTTAARDAADGVGVGTVEVSLDPDNLSTAAVFAIDCNTPPNTGSDWASGNYVVPINITTCDAGTQFVRADLCDYNGTAYASIVNNLVPSHSAGATGVVTCTFVRGTDYTPQTHSTSRLYVVCTFTNTDDHGNSIVGITPDQTITTPIVIPSVAASGAGWSGAGVW